MTINNAMLDVIHDLTCKSSYLLELTHADNTQGENKVLIEKVEDNPQRIEVLSRRCL